MTPDNYTNQEFMLNVGDGHKLYVHDWGNKKAKNTILFLHGGPGNGVNDGYKQRFDGSLQRVIFFDQRGSGKSTPRGVLEDNTSQKLVQDITKLINKLSLDKVIITGGSWGSTLGLIYAIENAKRVQSMVLSGIFTARKSEIDFLDKGEFRAYFPDVWENYQQSVPPEFQDNPSTYHYGNVFGQDQELANKSLQAYSNILEGPLIRLDDRFTPTAENEFDPNPAKIEMQYLKNNCFIPENYIFDNAHKLTMPIWLVQGRYDMVCPPITAYELNKLLPDSKLIWTTAGHGNDRANYDVVRTLLLSIN